MQAVLTGQRPSRPEDSECEGGPPSDELWELIQRAWRQNADERITLPEIRAYFRLVSNLQKQHEVDAFAVSPPQTFPLLPDSKSSALGSESSQAPAPGELSIEDLPISPDSAQENLIPFTVVWRGSAASVVLTRDGHDNWKGRQPMIRE